MENAERESAGAEPITADESLFDRAIREAKIAVVDDESFLKVLLLFFEKMGKSYEEAFKEAGSVKSEDVIASLEIVIAIIVRDVACTAAKAPEAELLVVEHILRGCLNRAMSIRMARGEPSVPVH